MDNFNYVNLCMQNKNWEPQKNLNYFSRQSPSKLKNIKQPISLLSDSLPNSNQAHIDKDNISSTKNSRINGSRKSKQIYDQRKDEVIAQSGNTVQDISNNEDNFILIQDQNLQQMHENQDTMSDWISIQQMPLKRPIKYYKQDESIEESVNIRRSVVEKQMKLRKLSKDQAKQHKNSYQLNENTNNTLSKVSNDRQLTRQFSFGSPIKIQKTVNLYSNQHESTTKTMSNNLLTKFYDDQTCKKLQQKHKRNEYLHKRKHQQFRKHQNKRKNAKALMSKTEHKDVSWKQFINKMLQKYPRKGSDESIKEFLNLHSQQLQEHQIGQINIESSDSYNQNAKIDDFYQQRRECNSSVMNESDDHLQNKHENGRISTQDQIPTFRYREKLNQDNYASKRQNQRLQEQWEQVQMKGKIDYVSKPRSEDLHQRLKQKQQKIVSQIFKGAKNQEPILVPQMFDINSMALYKQSLSMIAQSIKQVPNKLSPVYMNIYEKVLKIQIQNEFKLSQQHMIINILQCMIALSRQKLRPEDYVLAEWGNDQQRVITMNQVIIRSLIRKIVGIL